MGRKSASGGVAENTGKIRLDIWYRGRRMRPVLDMEWNERNRRAALRMVREIREKIRHGRFDLEDYFPEYSGLEALAAPSSTLTTFRDYAFAWPRSLGQRAAATREDYRKALDLVWLDELGDRAIKAIRYSELMRLIGDLDVAGKTLNNYLIRCAACSSSRSGTAHSTTIRLQLLKMLRFKSRRPIRSRWVEVEAILDGLAEREDIQVVNYFAAAFFAGFRPSEQIALCWLGRRFPTAHCASSAPQHWRMT